MHFAEGSSAFVAFGLTCELPCIHLCWQPYCFDLATLVSGSCHYDLLPLRRYDSGLRYVALSFWRLVASLVQYSLICIQS